MSRVIGTVLVMTVAMGSASGIAAADTPRLTSTPAEVAQSIAPAFSFNKIAIGQTAQAAYANDDERNYQIILRYVNTATAIPTFDRNGAINAGADPAWVDEFDAAFKDIAPRVAEMKKADPAKYAGGVGGYSWSCIVAIADMAGATVAAVAAIFASGGGLAVALAFYGLSGAGLSLSCY